ncbi:MAG: hypothetical protein OXN94_02175 [Chloroflexota bacterium]|nr:hypothetical protein [Chloroflexota bacterium]
MFDKLRSVLKQPFYVWLLGIYPILHLYSENLGLVKDREALYVCGVMLAATTSAFLVASRVIRCRYKTAFMLGICSLAFSLSGHVYVQIFIPRSLFVWTLLLPTALAILLVILWRRASSQVLASVTPTLNLILLILLAIPVTDIASSYVSKSINLHPISAFGKPSTAQNASTKVYDSKSQPDIYYIIPDGYPNDSSLQKVISYDNMAFSKALEDRGFIVVDHAQSNYWATLLSLASTLNMQYFRSNPSPYTDLDYLRISIADNAVARLFQELGYTYIQFLSGYLLPSPIADINREFTPQGNFEISLGQDMLPIPELENRQLPERRNFNDLSHFYKRSFLSLYIDTTYIRILASQLKKLNFRDESAPYDLFAPERFLATIDEVKSIASMPEATFAIVHLLKPHGPVVFNEKGEIRDSTPFPNHEEYFSEFSFTNRKFLEMIDSILESSKHPPVIIFQADHGSTYGETWKPERRLTHFDTYAAYYLPDPYSVSVPESYTLINTFPLILNEVIGTDYGMKENRLFELQVGYRKPFEQQDVSEEFAHS